MQKNNHNLKEFVRSPMIKQNKYFYKINEIKMQYSFILPFILSKVELGSNIKVEPVGDSYYLVVILLSLVALSCFYNIMAYFISLYLIQHYNVREKFPKLNKIFKYYEKSGFIFIIVECIICVVVLLILIITAFLNYYKITFT
jgi:hypothetical protein